MNRLSGRVIDALVDHASEWNNLQDRKYDFEIDSLIVAAPSDEMSSISVALDDMRFGTSVLTETSTLWREGAYCRPI